MKKDLQFKHYSQFMEKYKRKELDSINLDFDLKPLEKPPLLMPKRVKKAIKSVRKHYKWRYYSTPPFAMKRKKITQEQRDRLRKERGDLCQDCRQLRAHNFHHLNGIPSDNRDENILLVCVLCHIKRDRHMRIVRAVNRYYPR